MKKGTKVHSEEWKQHLREKMKGNKYHLGQKNSPESNEKRRIAMTGKKFPGRKQTPEHNRKIGLSKLGKKRKPFSKEWRDNIGKAHIGISRGEKSSSWKGGVTELRKLIRDSFKYRQWRSDIFTRDDFVCQICSVRGGKLQADHFPKTFNDIFYEYNIKSLEDAYNCEELWNINNGRTLCYKCHRETETWGRPHKNHGKNKTSR